MAAAWLRRSLRAVWEKGRAALTQRVCFGRAARGRGLPKRRWRRGQGSRRAFAEVMRPSHVRGLPRSS